MADALAVISELMRVVALTRPELRPRIRLAVTSKEYAAICHAYSVFEINTIEGVPLVVDDFDWSATKVLEHV